MRKPEKENSPPAEDPKKAAEIAWLREHRFAFFSIAHDRHAKQGRGALVIDASVEPLGENTPFYYARQTQIERQAQAQADEVSQHLASLVSEYDPRKELVAAFIRPGLEQFGFSLYQIGGEESLIEAVNIARRAGKRIDRLEALVYFRRL